MRVMASEMESASFWTWTQFNTEDAELLRTESVSSVRWDSSLTSRESVKKLTLTVESGTRTMESVRNVTEAMLWKEANVSLTSRSSTFQKPILFVASGWDRPVWPVLTDHFSTRISFASRLVTLARPGIDRLGFVWPAIMDTGFRTISVSSWRDPIWILELLLSELSLELTQMEMELSTTVKITKMTVSKPVLNVFPEPFSIFVESASQSAIFVENITFWMEDVLLVMEDTLFKIMEFVYWMKLWMDLQVTWAVESGTGKTRFVWDVLRNMPLTLMDFVDHWTISVRPLPLTTHVFNATEDTNWTIMETVSDLRFRKSVTSDAPNGIGKTRFAWPVLRDGDSTPWEFVFLRMTSVWLLLTMEIVLNAIRDLLYRMDFVSFKKLLWKIWAVLVGIGMLKFVYPALLDFSSTCRESVQRSILTVRTTLLRVFVLDATPDMTWSTETVNFQNWILFSLQISVALNGTGPTRSVLAVQNDLSLM